MSEEELLYEALKAPLGLVVSGNAGRFKKARAKLLKHDAALMELLVLGPDRAGNIYLLRTLEAKKATGELT